MNFGKILKDSQEIYRKFYKNLMIWVSLRVVVLLKYEAWVWAVLTLCQYGTHTDTVSVSVYTTFINLFLAESEFQNSNIGGK